MKTEIQNLIRTLNEQERIKPFKGLCIKRAANMPLYTWQDIWHEGLVRVLEKLLLISPDGSIPKCFRNPNRLRCYIIRTINNAANDLYRKGQREQARRIGLPMNSLHTSWELKIFRSDIDAARLVLKMARNNIRTKAGRFLLRAFTENKTFTQLASEEGVDYRTITRWLDKENLRPVAKAVVKAAAEVFGQDNFDEFITVAKHVFNPGKKANCLIKRIDKMQKQN